MADEAPKESFSIVVCGEGGVGKSAVTLNFIRNQFVEEYDPTIEDSYCKVVDIDGVRCTLDVTDTAGQEEYKNMWGDKYMRSGEGFLLVYSIIQQSSFEKIAELRDQIIKVKDNPRTPIVVIGNKCDLNEEREVSEEDGKRLKEQLKVDAFLETSAKLSLNVEAAFHELVRAIRRFRITDGIQPKIEDSKKEKKPASGGGGCCSIC
eukprot:Colp12_sorted_trinity150504_noHs@29714